ncbi:MAG: metallopeptidase family protein [Gemmatimonadota bacterium]|nr:metallopeptidase family protein [Gemmatimonadota bacterium]
MTFAEFEARAREVFAEIPGEYRSGVDGLEVERGIAFHPELPGIYTLGECRTEHYPTEFGGAGEVRSIVVLYYGSFLRLSREEPEWDWDEEIFETVTHEVRHHLESLASEDALEVQDWVEDQNFLRREGREFDPSFYRDGEPAVPGVYRVDGDRFLERELTPEEEREGSVVVEWEGRTLRVPLPEPLGEVHFLTLDPLCTERGDFVVVLLRRWGVWDGLRALLSGEEREVRSSIHPGGADSGGAMRAEESQ